MSLRRLSALLLVLFSIVSFPAFGADSPNGLDALRIVPLHRGPATVRPDLLRSNLDPAATAARLRTAVLKAATALDATDSAARVGGLAAPSKAAPLTSRIGRDVTVLFRRNGTPLQIHGAALQQPRPPHASAGKPADPAEAARDFLRANRALLALTDPDQELAIESQENDPLGGTVIRFEQRYKGLAVWPGELLAHVDSRGDVNLIEGAYAPTPRRLETEPLVKASEAAARAIAAVSPAAPGAAGPPELIVYAPLDRLPRLAWRLQVTLSLTSRWLVVVDAINGNVITRFNLIESGLVPGSGRDLSGTTRSLNVWQDGSMFFLLDAGKMMFDPTSTPPSPQLTRGAIFIADATNLPASSKPDRFPDSLSISTSTSATSWSVPDSVSAAYWLSQTYDYYLERHSRNSIDGNGGSLAGVVRLGLGFHNAFWDDQNQFMVFGDDDTYAGSLDVIAHEMTHGVTNHSAHLVYQDESGALNEAISDIFGEMTEARSFGSNDWILGSQLHTAVRDMKSPERFQQPSRYSQYVHTTSDNGGVHTNSGIINKAYYLLAEGLNGAIGKRDAEKIFYRMLTVHLTKNSQFMDARLAAITSADDLFGAGSAQSKKTGEAFDAVELFASAPVPDQPSIPAVNAPDSTLFVYRDAAKNAWFLGRRETAKGDPTIGVTLSLFDISPTRPSVTADGTIATFVDSVDDVCLTNTAGGSAEQCLDLPSQGIHVFSVGMSPDGEQFGFVLLKSGSTSTPDNRIIVVQASNGATATYTLTSPVFDGADVNTVRFADSMTFTADGQFLVYDAFNVLTANGKDLGAWSIYAIELDNGDTFTVVPPYAGLDIGNPALGHTSDNLITLEVNDSSSGQTSVMAGNLDSGDFAIVATERGADATPGYTGDDSAVVYAAGGSNSSGASLMLQHVGPDHFTPSGSPSLWLDNAAYATIYRRGTYSGPTTSPGAIAFTSSVFNGAEGTVATVLAFRSGGNKGAVSVSYSTSNGTGIGGTDYTPASGTLTWADGELGAKSFRVALLSDSAVEGTETVNLSLSSPGGSASLGSPAQAVLNIADSAPTQSPAPGKHRGARH